MKRFNAKYALFWYHPDHLGSSSYITNLAGEINQHMEYLPFGELLVEEHLNSYNSPFKFNAKEFDAETGNYYYGARYYDPKWSIWLSVDPLAESAPSWTPYRYGFNNPIRYTDPTGMFEDTYGIDDKGNIRHIDDRKYYDSNGNEVDRLYKMNSEFGVDRSGDYAESRVREDGTSILSDLSHSGETLKYGTSEIGGPTFTANKYLAYATSDEKTEINRIFDYASKNSKVEWGLIGFNDKNGEFNYQIGTLGLGDLEGQMGYSYAPSLPRSKGQGLYSIHSHSGDIGYKNQLESLKGDRGVGPQWLNNGYKSYQIYFPSDKSTWNIDKYGRPTNNVGL